MSSLKEAGKKIGIYKRIYDKFRYGLVLQVLRNFMARGGIEITPYYWVQEGVQPVNMPEIKGEISYCRVAFLEKDDIKVLGAEGRGYPEEELLNWLKNGKKCLGLKYKDEIASFLWINLKDCSFGNEAIILKDNEAYLSDMYTMESFRGRNLAAYLRYQSYGILHNMGRNKIYSVSEFFNKTAIKYKQKLNARNLKLILFIRLFNKCKWKFLLKSY